MSDLSRPRRDEDSVTPEHESQLRRILADAAGEPYSALQSLEEAKRAAAVVVMEGDYGGSIYLTCPARVVQCDEPTLRQLALDIDERDWSDPEGVGCSTNRFRLARESPEARGAGSSPMAFTCKSADRVYEPYA
jgi:hypothetical protein